MVAPAAGPVVRCEEGGKLTFPDNGEAALIARAWWGDPEREWEVGDGVGFMCTELVQERVVNFRGAVLASNLHLRGDPKPGTCKVLLLELEPGSARPEVAEAANLTHGRPEDVPSAPAWCAFVRHAQAQHNADEAFLSEPDTLLTERGRSQASAAAAAEAGAALRSADLVITSPLRRAMDTTALLLGDDDAGVRVMVHRLCAERWSSPCDEGSRKSELLQVLPERMLRWEGWDALPEQWWSQQGSDDWARADEFREFARSLAEQRVAFVGHGGFWTMVIGEYLGNCKVVYCDRQLAAQ